MSPSSRNELLPSSKEKEGWKEKEIKGDGKCFGKRDEDGWMSE